jgi:5,6-dimethylbenzimidazole synthase
MTPIFDDGFRVRLAELIAWRRDVRRFTNRPVPTGLIESLLDTAQLSPSVGNSQPWRWVQVATAAKRAEIHDIFAACNHTAQQAQPATRAPAYAALKLEGLAQAPLQYAVFCDQCTGQGHQLGRHSMAETLEYSTVAMITTFWLVARAAGVGVGWVSILDPVRVAAVLDVPAHWKLIAYLCVGWPEHEHLDPELERFGWQSRTDVGRKVEIR